MEENTQVLNDFFNEDDIQTLINSDKVQENYKIFLEKNKKSHTFTVTLTTELQNSFAKKYPYFNTDNLREVPMRWVIGEIPEHTDKAKNGGLFETSIVIYLNNDSSMFFCIDNNSYTIERNKAFIFSQKLKHKVEMIEKSSLMTPRLIMGPMNENGLSVGCSGYGYFNNIDDANSFTHILAFVCLNNPTLTPEEAGLIVPSNSTFNGWLLAPTYYPNDVAFSNGYPNNQLYISGDTYYDASFTNFTYTLYPSYTQIPVSNPYIIYGGANSSGNFWYGNSTGFPGFLYKKNLGVGTRRSTILGAGGNQIAQNAIIFNKYKPGLNGIGASTISNRRAKNRLASICKSSAPCGKFQPYLGKYSGYTWNVNGYFPYPPDP